MLAPSFIIDFSYPAVISQLRELGFYKVTELTFGAKMINRDYHKILQKNRGFVVASVCPGVVELIKTRFLEYRKNLIKVDSPMIATAKICKKTYPGCKTVFISPCNYKKIEAKKSKYVDYVVDFRELKKLFKRFKIKERETKFKFDRFYNDYTKIYPVAGGLSKTAHLKQIVKPKEVKIIGGVKKVLRFLKKPDKTVRFLDVTFCNGGCIGGPCINSRLPIFIKRRKTLNYLKLSKREDIPETRKGLIEKAKGVSFKSDYV